MLQCVISVAARRQRWRSRLIAEIGKAFYRRLKSEKNRSEEAAKRGQSG
jgi:hypothetical protein